MANDIDLSIDTNPIKNGTLIYGCSKTGIFQTKNNYVSNSPVIADIQSKFDNRFDDPNYYHGSIDVDVDGGDVS